MTATAPTVQLHLIPPYPPTLGKVEDVMLDRLPPDEALLGPEPSHALVESIQRWGVLEPVLVRAVGGALDYSNPATLVSGRRRIKALRRLLAEVPAGTIHTPILQRRYSRIPVRVISDPEGTLQDGRTEVLAVTTNAVRADNPVTDFRNLAYLVANLVARGEAEKAAIVEVARLTGLATGTVKQRLRLLALTPELQDDLLAGRLGYTVALHASRLGPEGQARLEELLDAGEPATLALVKQAKREAVRAHQASLLDDLPDPGGPGGAGEVNRAGEVNQTDLVARATALAQHLATIKMPILQEASATIEALVDALQERNDG